jgi:TnpA family transposase
LVSFTGKNHFYRANRELGRVFKTEYILQFMSDPMTRQRVRRGLLKEEEMHALARQVAYGDPHPKTGPCEMLATSG